ncbi:MAG: transketolase, partial [Actinomycetia bacterium]|nr:transketolase [Actinomycetes bacterium]
AEKWKAFGWNTVEIDGHNFNEILEAFQFAASVKNKPTMIVANTIKGKGVSFMENNVDFHGKAPDEIQTKQALEELRKSLEEIQ